jgi:hypothetical protein
MIDNEIISELQAVSEWFKEHGRNTNTAVVEICEKAIDLINRQREEIEGYKKHIDNDIIYVNAVRAEAVKEFAERLKATFPTIDDLRCTDDDIYTLNLIDDLMKEFTEGDKK